MSAITTPWKPMSEAGARVPRLERGRRRARVLAGNLGHLLGGWDDDTSDSSIASCLVCGELAAVDAARYQSVEITGFATSRLCAGDPIW